jgi:hypothetical protein
MNMRINMIHPLHGDKVVLAIRAIIPGELDRTFFDMINSAYSPSAGSDNVHVILDAGVRRLHV